ncbi:MAG: GNAT family N-acetyltransferase [Bacilli bacterium]|nr:GNAT family N-acetyltransferase [Bacilli bacterium]
MNYEIRRLETGDIESLLELFSGIFKSKIQAKCLYDLVDNDNVIDLVAIMDNKVIGHANVDIRINLFTGEKYFYLNYFCVHENYRCYGIGGKLIDKLEELALQNNISFMEFTSGNKRLAAHSFYRGKGYEIRDTSVFIKYFNKEQV